VNDSNGRSWELLDQFVSFEHNELHSYRRVVFEPFLLGKKANSQQQQ